MIYNKIAIAAPIAPHAKLPQSFVSQLQPRMRTVSAPQVWRSERGNALNQFLVWSSSKGICYDWESRCFLYKFCNSVRTKFYFNFVSR